MQSWVIRFAMQSNIAFRSLYCKLHKFFSNSFTSVSIIYSNINQYIFGNITTHSCII